MNLNTLTRSSSFLDHPAMKAVVQRRLNAVSTGIVFAEHQKRVTATYLHGYEQTLHALGVEIRNDVDRYYANEVPIELYEKKCPLGKMHVGRYPEGFCLTMTEQGIELIRSTLNSQSTHDLIVRLRKMINCGGVLKRVWGIEAINNRFTFQNALQIGNYILDVARGTGGTVAKESVVLTSTENCHINTRCTFAQYGETYRDYWGCRLFRTREIIPNLALFMPFVALDNSGRLAFPAYSDAAILNYVSGLEDARAILEGTSGCVEDPPNFVIKRCRQLFDKLSGECWSSKAHKGISEWQEVWRNSALKRLRSDRPQKIESAIAAVIQMTASFGSFEGHIPGNDR